MTYSSPNPKSLRPKSEPITPEEATKSREFNPTLIQAVNELIVEKWNGSSISIDLESIKGRFHQLNTDPSWTTKRLFEQHHFDFEDLYRSVGWKVKYESPCYNESFEPFYTFSVK